MFVTIKIKKIILCIFLAVIILGAIGVSINNYFKPEEGTPEVITEEELKAEKENIGLTDEENQPIEEKQPEEAEPAEKKYIKWVDFNVSYGALERALNIDIESQKTDNKICWIDLLSYLGAKYGGEFSRYKTKDLDELVKKLNEGQKIEDLTKDMKYFAYYHEAYSAVLSGFVGKYKVQINDKDNEGQKIWKETYGLKAFSPIAKGYSFNHYEDFGNQRSYGYARKHLGHDLMGNVGTPIIAIESGIVEALGWNQYGGWRIGIRSFDTKRYYYYAHLRKNHPYNKILALGDVVKAGDVIGYLGMTGYSTKENVNNIRTPHLHVGIQLIFNEKQKDGINQIWIDLYDIVRLLQKNQTRVYKDPDTKDYYRVYDFYDLSSSKDIKTNL